MEQVTALKQYSAKQLIVMCNLAEAIRILRKSIQSPMTEREWQEFYDTLMNLPHDFEAFDSEFAQYRRAGELR